MQSRIFDGYLEDVVDFQYRASKEREVLGIYNKISPDDFNDQGPEVKSIYPNCKN
jgi:hypothetical protein